MTQPIEKRAVSLPGAIEADYDQSYILQSRAKDMAEAVVRCISNMLTVFALVSLLHAFCSAVVGVVIRVTMGLQPDHSTPSVALQVLLCTRSIISKT